MEPVQNWAAKHMLTLRRLSGQKVKGLDFSDDRLSLCLAELSKSEVWQPLEKELETTLLRVYNLNQGIMRMDATVGTVGHDPEKHSLLDSGENWVK